MMPEQDSQGTPLLPGPNANKITISELKSNFPWNIQFSFGLPNFIGGDPVIIDEVLRQEDEAITRTFNLAGLTLEATGDGVIGGLVPDLAITILGQEVTIPLDGSSLGDFAMTIKFGSLYFSELQAYVFKELTADEFVIDGFPPELTGIGFPGLELELEIFNEINLPILLDILMD